MTIAVFEIRLPMIGSRPTTKVIATRVLTSGRSTPNSGQRDAEVEPREERVDRRDPELREDHAPERGRQASGLSRDALGERAPVRVLRGLLQRQQRADDHAHQHMNQRAPEIAAGELQRARVRTQPFDQRPLHAYRRPPARRRATRPAGARARPRRSAPSSASGAAGFRRCCAGTRPGRCRRRRARR